MQDNKIFRYQSFIGDYILVSVLVYIFFAPGRDTRLNQGSVVHDYQAYNKKSKYSKGKGRPMTFLGSLGSEVSETSLFSGPVLFEDSVHLLSLAASTLFGVRYPSLPAGSIGRSCANRHLV